MSEDDPAKKGPPPAVTGLQDQQRALTRRLLMDSAEQVFAAKGYRQATVEDIIRTAGTSRATFYLHFSGKRELVEALIERFRAAGVERWRDLDDVLAKRSRATRAGLRSWLVHRLDVWRQQSHEFIGVSQAASGDPDLARRQFEATTDYVDVLKNAPWSDDNHAGRGRREQAWLAEEMTQRAFLLIATGVVELSTDDVVIDLLTDMWWSVLHVPGRAGG